MLGSRVLWLDSLVMRVGSGEELVIPEHYIPKPQARN